MNYHGGENSNINGAEAEEDLQWDINPELTGVQKESLLSVRRKHKSVFATSLKK